MSVQTLGGVAFEWDPDEMTIPESKKVVAVVPTYSGSAIFQWEALLQGTRVILKWDWMSVAQYNILRTAYLSMNQIEWFTGIVEGESNISYNVIVIGLDGSYHKVHLYDLPYRKDVTLQFDIRSAV